MTHDVSSIAWRRSSERVLIALFLSALFLPPVGMWVPIPLARAQVRWETPLPPPALRKDRESLLSLPVRFYRYFGSSFGFRGLLIRGHAQVKTKVLRTSSSPEVILGRKEWLYYAADGELDCMLRTAPFDATQLAAWLRVVEHRRAWLSRRGIKLLVVVGPDKHTVYPEFLPAWVRPCLGPSRLDQFYAAVPPSPDLAMVDVRPALRAAKSRYQLYHRIDTHWNEVGGLLVTREIVTALQQWYPEAQPLDLRDYRIVPDPGRIGDLGRMLGMEAKDLVETRLTLVPRAPSRVRFNETLETVKRSDLVLDLLISDKPGGPIPRGVILRDSFSKLFTAPLSETFAHAVYTWRQTLDADLIAKERPNVVIWEFVERSLMRPPPPE